MASPERPSIERLNPLENGRWEELVEHFHGKAAIAERLRLGIEVSYILRDGAARSRHNLEKNADTPIYAASLMKLGIAGAAIEAGIPPEGTLRWDEERRDETGSGRYDRPGAPTQATVGEVIEDMLAYSGNTAVRALAPQLNGAKGINDYLTRHYDETSVIDAGNNAVIFGNTTPFEALRMLDTLYKEPGTELAGIARQAMENNQISSMGIRRHMRIRQDAPYTVANKSGSYPGDDPNNKNDPHPIPYAVVHDVGIVENAQGQRLEYAILTRAPRYNDGSRRGRAAHLMAEQTVNRMGLEVAYTLLGRSSLNLGARAAYYTRLGRD